VNGIFQSAEGGSLARDVSYKGHVKKALEQAELKDVTVSEDQDKNTITLGGSLIPAMQRPKLQM
jgi:hypothetical protein